MTPAESQRAVLFRLQSHIQTLITEVIPKEATLCPRSLFKRTVETPQPTPPLMNGPNLFRESGAYLALNLEPRPEDTYPTNRHAPAITIARQTGARGVSICTLLHERLQSRDEKDPLRWRLFDSELSKEILKEHNLPTYLEKFIPDQAMSEFEGTINEMLGRHPSLWTLFKDTKETIGHLARTGHSILVGRGGNFITRTMGNVLNVRLMGSHARRLQNIAENMQISEKMAEALLKHEDHGRRSYVKQHYHADIDDPNHYDLVINTDHFSDEAVCDLIMQALPKEG